MLSYLKINKITRKARSQKIQTHLWEPSLPLKTASCWEICHHRRWGQMTTLGGLLLTMPFYFLFMIVTSSQPQDRWWNRHTTGVSKWQHLASSERMFCSPDVLGEQIKDITFLQEKSKSGFGAAEWEFDWIQSWKPGRKTTSIVTAHGDCCGLSHSSDWYKKKHWVLLLYC